jgi:hypothetical protein
MGGLGWFYLGVAVGFVWGAYEGFYTLNGD